MIDNSYYIILNRLKAFANGHYLINTFTYHEIANFDITKNPHYPIMHAVPLSMNPSKGAIDYSFEITFADWVRAKEDKQENEVTVISDLHRCALDLCAEITNGNILFGNEVEIFGDAIITPFIDEFANTLSGVTLQITIRIPYDWSACDIPANWVDGTGDIPDFGGRSLTMDIYDDGNFVIEAREMNFVGSGVTVTYTGNRAIVTINGGGGGGGSVDGVTGNIVNNTDPANPVVTQVQPDWNASSGLGQILNKPSIPNAQVNSDWDANSGVAEILNKPDLNDLPYIPLPGTVSGSPVTGTIEYADPATVSTLIEQVETTDLVFNMTNTGFGGDGFSMLNIDASTGENSQFTLHPLSAQFGNGNGGFIQFTPTQALLSIPTSGALKYLSDYSSSFVLRSLIDLAVMKSRIWTKAGTPTTTDDSTEGYVVGSLIWDTTNSILYRCTDNTDGAAVWDVAISGGGAVDSVNGQTGVVVLDATDIGLGNVDNTSDADKPISTATQTALDNLTPSKSKFAIIEQDFMSVGTGSYNQLLTTATLSGTQSSAVGQLNHPGIVGLLDSGVANGGFAITTNNNMLVLAGGEKATFVFQDRNTTTRATSFIRMGFIDSVTSVLPTDGVFAQIQGGVVTGYARNNNTQTATGTTISITQNTWYSLTVEIISTTIATFTLYSEAGAVLWTSNITTNIPSTTGRETGFGVSVYESSTSAAAEILWLDYMRLDINRTLTR